MPERKKITRKVISKSPQEEVRVEKEQIKEETQKQFRTKKVCHFCQSKTIPSYVDLVVLKRYISDRSKIVAKLKSGICARHQRAVTKHIKYARHLSLLPFVPKV